MTYAVFNAAGSQFLVTEGSKLTLNKLHGDVNKTVEFEEVLLFGEEEGDIKIGKPYIKDAKVVAKVISQGKDDKKRVFKMLRRHRRRVNKGHRQDITELEIQSIVCGASTKEKTKTVAKKTSKITKTTTTKKTATTKPTVKKAKTSTSTSKKATK